MNNLIMTAINRRNLIQLWYNGGLRIVEPHCYGQSTAGNETLRAYQVDGYSSSSSSQMGWRMFDLRHAENITVLSSTFNSARPDYRRNDKGMELIYAQL